MAVASRLHCLTLALALLAGAASAQAADCPTEAEVKAAITKWHTDYNMAETHRYIWKIKSVSNFQFSPIKMGRIMQKQVEYGARAQDVCPVRVEFSYLIENNSGEKKPYKRGEKEVHLFYKNGFDEWVYKTESG